MRKHFTYVVIPVVTVVDDIAGVLCHAFLTIQKLAQLLRVPAAG